MVRATIVIVGHGSSLEETRALVAHDIIHHTRRIRHPPPSRVGNGDSQGTPPTRFPSRRTAQDGRASIAGVLVPK
jgi:hypothetical protein